MNQDITDVKIIYPSEVSRKEAMHRFQDLIDGAGQVDPNQHLTIERLFSQLHLDLRLEKIIPDNAFTFELIHKAWQRKHPLWNYISFIQIQIINGRERCLNVF